MAIYVEEAMRGQLARASTAAAAGRMYGTTGPSTAELRRTLAQLVDEAVARKAAEFNDDSAVGAPDPLHVALTVASAPPGAPKLPPPRQVRGLKGDREVGVIHEVVIADPALPREAWVARCPWRFGLAPHVLLTGREVTCARCISRRTVEERGQAFA